MSIARARGITVDDLVLANCLSVKTIYVGQILLVPGSSYTVPPNPTQALQAAREEAEEQLRNSNIAYNKPVRMNKGDTTDVELLLNPSLSQADLGTMEAMRGAFVTSTAEPGKLIGSSGEEVVVTTANIEITDKMRAKLFSKNPNAFRIDERSELEQVIRPNNTTLWRWSITANVEGPQTLELVLYRLIRYGDEETWTELETYRDDIIVDVSPIDRIRSLDWKWIIGIIVTMLLIPAFWRWFDKRKSNPYDNGKQPVPKKYKK